MGPRYRTQTQGTPARLAPRPPQKSSNLVPVLIVVSVACLVFLNSLKGEFVWDDNTQITKNPTIRSFSNLPKALTSGFWSFASSSAGITDYYRPFQTVAYIAAYHAGGLSPVPYHALNVAFHAAASVFLLLFCTEIGFAGFPALFAALLFATHPVHTESVAWIGGIPDVMCGAFYAAALWAGICYLNTQRRLWLGASTVSFLFALFAKEMAITLPAVMFLIATFHPRFAGCRLRTKIEMMISLAAAAVVYGGLRFAALGTQVVGHTTVRAGLFDWISLAAECFVYYLRYLVFPHPLAAYHLLPIALADRIVPTFISVVAILAYIWIFFMIREKHPEIACWMITLAISITPVLYLQAISPTSFFAERYLYIPSILFLILLCAASVPLKRRGYVRLSYYAILCAFAAMTLLRNVDWSTAERLYIATLNREPEVVAFRNNLAEIYLQHNDNERAKAHLETAWRNWQDKRFVQRPFEAYGTKVGLAVVALRRRDYASAQSHLEYALQMNPEGDWAYMYLGAIFMERDRNYAEATRYFQRAIQLGPLNDFARVNLGAAFFLQGKLLQARQMFVEAVQINPMNADAQNRIRLIDEALGRKQK